MPDAFAIRAEDLELSRVDLMDEINGRNGQALNNHISREIERFVGRKLWWCAVPDRWSRGDS
jgi:hypothetical protein